MFCFPDFDSQDAGETAELHPEQGERLTNLVVQEHGQTLPFALLNKRQLQR